MSFILGIMKTVDVHFFESYTKISFSLWLLIICSKRAYSIEQTRGEEGEGSAG